ncbi:MAG: hypothetical protein L3J52_10075 [Proteobacteria bacterium]|nr:hypothetical protein [Pseudomonadota bacterium]
MKKLIILSLFATFMVSAMSADEMKDAALEACNTQAEQMPAESRDLVLKSCKCYVDNTDYAAVLSDTTSGDTDKLQADALAVAEKCQKEAM